MNIEKHYLLPEKTVRTSLQNLTGIGKYFSNQICDYLGLNSNYKIKHLTHSERESLISILEQQFIFETKYRNLQKKILQNQIKIKSVKGFRRKLGLPCNGQRTKTNAKTAAKFKNRW